ncbi:MAG: hypothetical protein E7391_00315 [Ruminococcaceae bacterium]|nr:hypothetical protein [Oscillospiraceae bacterium]
MARQNNFPEGTIISGDLAFVPNPKDAKNGFDVVNIKTGKRYEKFSDCIFDGHEDASDDKKEIVIQNDNEEKEVSIMENNIEFDINYDDLIDDGSTVEIFEDTKAEVKKKEVNESIHKGHRERMKKRFREYGLSNFAPHEVLEMLLYYTHERRDTNPIAHNLINEFNDIQSVFKADTNALSEVDGIGEESALFISFIRQLLIYLNQNITDKVTLSTSTSAGQFCCKYFAQHTEEHFIVLVLDTTRSVKKIVEISQGTENETAYYPRKVVEAAIKYKANMIMVAHNHTGNSVHPSPEDTALSNQLNTILNAMGISLVDHIICCENSFTSFSDRGML